MGICTCENLSPKICVLHGYLSFKNLIKRNHSRAWSCWELVPAPPCWLSHYLQGCPLQRPSHCIVLKSVLTQWAVLIHQECMEPVTLLGSQSGVPVVHLASSCPVTLSHHAAHVIFFFFYEQILSDCSFALNPGPLLETWMSCLSPTIILSPRCLNTYSHGVSNELNLNHAGVPCVLEPPLPGSSSCSCPLPGGPPLTDRPL